jgi:hypothetical protein
MASGKLNDKDLAEIHALAKQWGKIVVRRAFGDPGPGRDVDLDALELVAVAAAAGLAAGALEEATQQQAQHWPAEQPCPRCGRPCPTQPQSRPVVVQGGPFLHHEPVGHGPACRRHFFSLSGRFCNGTALPTVRRSAARLLRPAANSSPSSWPASCGNAWPT